jgi:hypothetical protein
MGAPPPPRSRGAIGDDAEESTARAVRREEGNYRVFTGGVRRKWRAAREQEAEIFGVCAQLARTYAAMKGGPTWPSWVARITGFAVLNRVGLRGILTVLSKFFAKGRAYQQRA